MKICPLTDPDTVTSGLAPGDELLSQNVAVPRVPGELLHEVRKDESQAHLAGMTGLGLVKVASGGDLARSRAGVDVRRPDLLHRVLLSGVAVAVHLEEDAYAAGLPVPEPVSRRFR